MKDKIYIVVASQDYSSANHKFLWEEFSKMHKTIVVDIPADYVVTILKRKKYRLAEANKGPSIINENLYVVRPKFIVRHEMIPFVFKKYISTHFWRAVGKCVTNYSDYQIQFISYDAIWIRLIDFSGLDAKVGYYLFDEVRYNAKDCSIDQKRYDNDEFACINSDIILSMTNTLTESRRRYNSHVLTVGNGGIYVPEIKKTIKLRKSVAFIGNFRNWIDIDLLEDLINLRSDITFAFAGNIENDMKVFFNHLLNTYDNVIYMGKYSKDRMAALYTNFDAVMIPYKHNPFIQATRPIKIVESILAGTPVVTVPMAGYEECKFIRFAENVQDFSNQIDYILSNPINKCSQEYLDFVKRNTWESVARTIEYEFNK